MRCFECFFFWMSDIFTLKEEQRTRLRAFLCGQHVFGIPPLETLQPLHAVLALLLLPRWISDCASIGQFWNLFKVCPFSICWGKRSPFTNYFYGIFAEWKLEANLSLIIFFPRLVRNKFKSKKYFFPVIHFLSHHQIWESTIFH